MSTGLVVVPIAIGELFDKLSILEIKADRITDPFKLAAVRHELQLLVEARAGLGLTDPALVDAAAELKAINESLWQIEDDIREHERRSDFGPSFVALARSVYLTNDLRAEVKRRINELTGSGLSEQKSYRPY